MLTENKFNKYLIYAIGEIVLVVIGILIAISISNWNENNKYAKWEEKFLIDLRSELEGDLQQLNNTYTVQKTKGKACEILLELIALKSEDRKEDIDSVFVSIQAVNPTFFPTTGVYESGLASGKLEYINNDSLKYMITNLYNSYYKRLVYNGEILDNVVEKVDWEKGKFYNSEKQQINSWESVLNSEFHNQIRFLKDQNTVYYTLVEVNLYQIEKVIASISKELSDKN